MENTNYLPPSFNAIFDWNRMIFLLNVTKIKKLIKESKETDEFYTAYDYKNLLWDKHRQKEILFTEELHISSEELGLRSWRICKIHHLELGSTDGFHSEKKRYTYPEYVLLMSVFGDTYPELFYKPNESEACINEQAIRKLHAKNPNLMCFDNNAQADPLYINALKGVGQDNSIRISPEYYLSPTKISLIKDELILASNNELDYYILLRPPEYVKAFNQQNGTLIGWFMKGINFYPLNERNISDILIFTDYLQEKSFLYISSMESYKIVEIELDLKGQERIYQKKFLNCEYLRNISIRSMINNLFYEGLNYSKPEFNTILIRPTVYTRKPFESSEIVDQFAYPILIMLKSYGIITYSVESIRVFHFRERIDLSVLTDPSHYYQSQGVEWIQISSEEIFDKYDFSQNKKYQERVPAGIRIMTLKQKFEIVINIFHRSQTETFREKTFVSTSIWKFRSP